MFKNRKQKGFGLFDIAGYCQRRYRGHGEDEGWYLLTNLGTLKEAVATFKCRSGIEAMFKDCKTVGTLHNSFKKFLKSSFVIV
jgi:hypothetical protein